MCLGYNLRRAANLLGFERLMELMGSPSLALSRALGRLRETIAATRLVRHAA